MAEISLPKFRRHQAIVHKCMVPPDLTRNRHCAVVPDGDYTIHETLVTLKLLDGTTKELTHGAEMAHPCAKAGTPPVRRLRSRL